MELSSNQFKSIGWIRIIHIWMIWEGKECLHLVLMKDPFERIANGKKVIEYRDRTDYWNRRLFGKEIKLIFFQYAYHKNPTHMLVKVNDVKITDRWELHLGDIIHFDNRHIDGLECDSYNNWYRSLKG